MHQGFRFRLGRAGNSLRCLGLKRAFGGILPELQLLFRLRLGREAGRVFGRDYTRLRLRARKLRLYPHAQQHVNENHSRKWRAHDAWFAIMVSLTIGRDNAPPSRPGAAPPLGAASPPS
eukprot:COSAG05_NODE_1081_length_5940_cov_4.264852_8_plen_119_part_00